MSDLITTNPVTVLKYISVENHYVGRWGFSSRPDERPGMLEAARSTRIVADLCLGIDRLRALRNLPTFDLYTKCQAEYSNPAVGKVRITHLEPGRTITDPPNGALLSASLGAPAVENFERELNADFAGIAVAEVDDLQHRISQVVNALGGVTGESRPVAQELLRFIHDEIEPLLAESKRNEMWFLTPALLERAQDRALATGLALQLGGQARAALLVLNLLVTLVGVASPALSAPMAVAAALLAIGDGSDLFLRIGESFTRPELEKATPPELGPGDPTSAGDDDGEGEDQADDESFADGQ